MFGHNVLAIDFGSCSIKLVVGKQQGNSIIVDTAVRVPTPPNSYQDGKIFDMNAIRQAISDAIEKNKIKVKRAICTIESTAVIRRDIDLPTVKPDEMDTMVKLEIEQYLPIMLNEYVVEYKVHEEYVEDNIKKSKILVAALPKTIAEDFLALLGALKLTPVALDIHSNAISKVMKQKVVINSEDIPTDKTIALIDFGCNSINVNIVSKGNTRFSRLIPSGSSMMDISIANSFNLELTEAEKKKVSEASFGNSESMSMHASMISDIVKSNIDIWLQDIQRLFQYYTSRGNENRIDEIFLYGGGSRMSGMDTYFKDSLNIPTKTVKNIDSIKINKHKDAFEFDYYMNAISAIIRN